MAVLVCKITQNILRYFKYSKYQRICRSYQAIRHSSSIQENYNLVEEFNADIAAGGVIPVFKKSALFGSKIAVVDELGQYSYSSLYKAANEFAQTISNQLRGATGEPIAYLCNNDASHIIVQWAIWISGNIAVPLSPSHPPAMLQYFVEDTGAPILVVSDDYAKMMRPISQELKRNLIILSRAHTMQTQVNQFIDSSEELPPMENRSASFYANSTAMIMYTSGTTSKPKGVVWSHKAWETQILALHDAWKYSADDVVLLTLPLHHVHGQLNAVNASLAAGAKLDMIGTFSPHRVWSKLLAMSASDVSRITVFHAVPTIYSRLVEEYDKIFTKSRQKEYIKETLKTKVRLMCSGSAPLPVPLFQRWEDISGHRLLERYGMTEVGMALSNPYQPEKGRTPGTVGLPLPGISIRLVNPISSKDSPQTLLTVSSLAPKREFDGSSLGLTKEKDLFDEPPSKSEKNNVIVVKGEGVEEVDGLKGDLLVKGEGIFDKYWQRPEQTKAEFTHDGWFMTGDTVLYEGGRLSILGRTSIDIIKTGGYKVSALQVETALLANSKIADVAVLGLEDPAWGEKIAAVVVCTEGTTINLEDLKKDAANHLAPYQLPSVLYILESLPRNLMGKVDKNNLKKDVQQMKPILKSTKK